MFKSHESSSFVLYPEFWNFKKGWMYKTSIAETEWTLVFGITYDELFNPLFLIMYRMLFVSVIGILLIYLIITYITNKLIEPLKHVTRQLKNFNNLSGESSLHTLNEITLVSESLGFLRKWYEKYQSNERHEKRRSDKNL